MAEIFSDNKRIANNTILLYIRMLFVMAISLLTSRYVLAALGEEDFGIYNVVGGVVSTFTFISLALSNATSRYITYYLGKGDKDELAVVFSTAFIVQLFIAIIILVLAETAGLWFLNTQMNIPDTRMFAANWVYQFSILTTIISIISIPYNSEIIAHEKMGIFAYISIFDVVMKLLIVFLLYLSSFDYLILYSFLIMLIQVIDLFFYIIYCRRNFEETKFKWVKDLSLIKEMGAFAGWSTIGNLAYVCYTQGLNILLNIFFGPAVNAARGIAVQVQSVVRNFVVNFQTAVNPQIIKSYAERDLVRMRDLICVSSRLSFMIMFCLVLPVVLEIKFLLSLWLTIVPDHTVSFVRLVLLVALIDCFERPLTNAMNATGQIRKYQLYSCSIMLLILPFSYLLVKGGMPSEIVFVVQFIIMTVSCVPEFLILKGYIQLSGKYYFSSVVLDVLKVLVLSSILPVFLHLFLPSSITSSLIVLALSFFSVIVTTYFVGLKDGERAYIKSLFRKKLANR